MKTVALLFGGKSPEHEISLRSAKNILAAIDRTQYEVLLIAVDRQGCWHLAESIGTEVDTSFPQLTVVPGATQGQVVRMDNGQALPQIDVVFPIIHGPNGEDGTLQGMLRCLNLPFVGPDVLGSAAAMDKDVAKRMLREAGLLVAEGLCFRLHEKDSLDYLSITNRLGSPIFIKPANMGSSVGVHKVRTAEEFQTAIDDAFCYDSKLIIEEMLVGREVECAVLGNELPEVTHVGEVVTPEEYDYEAKYVSADAAKIVIPASVTDQELIKLQLVAKQAYQVLECEGMTRVDMFLTAEGKVYVNELNTLPGFTSISMYPKLWEHNGLSYTALISELLRFAMERHERQQALKTAWGE